MLIIQSESKTLISVYNREIKESYESRIEVYHPFRKFFENFNSSCYEDILKLSENGEKELKDEEIQILMMKSIASCSNYEESEFYEVSIEDVSKSQQYNLKDGDLQCYKLALKRMNSTMKFIESFDEKSLATGEIESCEQFFKTKEAELREIISLSGIKDVESFTCGSMDINEVAKMYSTLVVIGSELDSEEKKLDMKNLSNYFVEKMDKIFECIMSKLAKQSPNTQTSNQEHKILNYT